MLSVALTGNIASGKSTVAELFRRWGATVIDADAIVRELQVPGSPVLEAMAARFGAGVLRPDGTLDRAAVRTLVMGDPEARAALNRIVHPAVQERREALLAVARSRGDRIVITEIPLLFEAADPAAFDAVVLVDAPEPMRRARLLADRGLSSAEVDDLLRAQLPAAGKRARSHYVIENDADRAALERAAGVVWQALLARA